MTRVIPARLQHILGALQTDSGKKISKNIAWLCVDKGIALADAFIVGAMVARYLGPTQLGALAYAAALCTMTWTLVTLGFDSVIVRQFVNEPTHRGRVLWSVAFFRLLLGVLAFGMITSLAIAGVLGAEGGEPTAVVIIVSIQLLCAPFTLIRLLLDAEVSAKWHVWINNSVILLAAIVRGVLVVTGGPLIAFAVVTAGITVVGCCVLYGVVKRLGILPAFEYPSWQQFKSLLVECWPLILSALSIGLYMNADVVMLKVMKDSSVAGIYTVATRLSSVWYFIPVILSTSLLPSLAQTHSRSPAAYLKRFQWYMDVNAVAALGCVLLALTVFPTLVLLLYGKAYSESIAVFWYHIWAVPFVFLGVARSQHLTLESFHRFNMLSTLLGVGANLIFNWLLIPQYGAQGAAVATVASYGLSAYVSSFFVRELRSLGWMQTKALLSAPWRLYQQPLG